MICATKLAACFFGLFAVLLLSGIVGCARQPTPRKTSQN